MTKTKKFKNYGVKVRIKHKRFGKIILRNVTEIHYRYRDARLAKAIGQSIAFESDIHYTGITYDVNGIEEFETTPETSKAKSF